MTKKLFGLIATIIVSTQDYYNQFYLKQICIGQQDLAGVKLLDVLNNPTNRDSLFLFRNSNTSNSTVINTCLIGEHPILTWDNFSILFNLKKNRVINILYNSYSDFYSTSDIMMSLRQKKHIPVNVNRLNNYSTTATPIQQYAWRNDYDSFEYNQKKYLTI